MLEKLKEKTKLLKKEIVPIYYALFDSRTPFLAKLMALFAIGYLLSPIDLIPDFIPVVGLLDDLIIVPILIALTIKLIPDAIIEDIKSKIDTDIRLKKKWYYAVPVIVLYLIVTSWLIIIFIKPYLEK